MSGGQGTSETNDLDGLKRRLFQLETLYEIGRESVRAQDMPAMLGVILPMVMGAFGAVSGTAFVGDGAGEVEASATRGFFDPKARISPAEWANVSLPLITTAAHAAATDDGSRSSLISSDVLTQSLPEVGLDACVPVAVDDATWGALAIGAKLTGEPYSGEDRALLRSIVSNVVPYLRSVKLLESLREALSDVERAKAETAEVLARSVEARDAYTQGHAERVAKLGHDIAMHIGLSDEERALIVLAGRFHDVGKIGVRDAVLNKPGRLTAEEFREVQEHPVVSARIVGGVSLFRDAAPLIVAHHEKLDGSGYPSGLQGDGFPLGARILAVADIYDAVTTDRSYRAAMPIEKALDILDGDARRGLQDRDLVAALVATLPATGR